MNTRPVSLPDLRDCAASLNSDMRVGPVKPMVLRLNDVPATAKNRDRIGERIRRLNRALEESGVAFRLRVL